MGWKDKKVLVTGGAGFIGSRVVVNMVEMGARVRVVDDLSKGEASNLTEVMDKIEFIHGNLIDGNVARQCLKDIDVCFHFAALIGGIGFFHKYPGSSIRHNTLMNLNLWDAAIDSDTKMICVSSSMVFERTTQFPTPETAVETCPPPLTGYGFSKLIAEYIARTYHDEYSVPYVIVRPFNAYGPGENTGDWVGYAHIIPDLVDKVLSGQYPLEILGNGNQIRSYTYVDDVANGIIFAAEHGENDDFNIGTGAETNVTELAEMVWNICGRKEPLKFKHLESYRYDVQKRIPEISKLKKLGWQAETSREEGLTITIEWLKDNR